MIKWTKDGKVDRVWVHNLCDNSTPATALADALDEAVAALRDEIAWLQFGTGRILTTGTQIMDMQKMRERAEKADKGWSEANSIILARDIEIVGLKDEIERLRADRDALQFAAEHFMLWATHEGDGDELRDDSCEDCRKAKEIVYAKYNKKNEKENKNHALPFVRCAVNGSRSNPEEQGNG